MTGIWLLCNYKDCKRLWKYKGKKKKMATCPDCIRKIKIKICKIKRVSTPSTKDSPQAKKSKNKTEGELNH